MPLASIGLCPGHHNKAQRIIQHTNNKATPSRAKIITNQLITMTGHNNVKVIGDGETLTHNSSNVQKLTKDAAFRRISPSIAANSINSTCNLNYLFQNSPHAPPTPISCWLLVSTQCVLPAASALLPLHMELTPSCICTSSSSHTFRRLLKTHRFQQAFSFPWKPIFEGIEAAYT